MLNDSYHVITLDRQRQMVVARTVEFAARLQKAIFQKVVSDDLDDLIGKSRSGSVALEN